MTTPEPAHGEVKQLVTNFKNLPGLQRRSMNEIQTRLGYILSLFRA